MSNHNIDLSEIRNKSKKDRNYETLRELPISIRDYLSDLEFGEFDRIYEDRGLDTFMQRFRTIRYPIDDRDFGSPNEEVANLYYNLYNEQETEDLIDDFLDRREWVYHPVREFEDWRHIARLYYNNEDFFWAILVFNRITDPFQALKDFNAVRVPAQAFIFQLPIRKTFSYGGSNFKVF